MNPSKTAYSLHSLILQARDKNETFIALERKEYLCSPDLLPEKLCYISNNDSGIKKILFDIDGFQNGLTIDGNGAIINIIGEIIPFYIRNCSGITIKNISFDWVRPAISEAKVICASNGFIDFSFEPDLYPMLVDQGRLVAFHENHWSTDSLWNLLCFDPNRKELLPGQDENWHLKSNHTAQQLSSTTIRLFADYTTTPPVGTPIALMHGNRVCPGIVIDNCENITIESVTAFHAMGMALIAQVSKNITLDHFNVIPSSNRLFSSWVDATHFVDCDGTIEMKHCVLKGQFDDASNIHGAFWKVQCWVSKNRFIAKIMHPQQTGVIIFRPGDTIAFHDINTLSCIHQNSISAVHLKNQAELEIELSSPVHFDSGDMVVRRHMENAFVYIHDCEFGANRGRGLLLSQSGKIIVEKNSFHVSGHAIEIAGDANYWWESSPVNNVTIQNNTFDNCNFGVCGKRLISICPDLPRQKRCSIFHTNISIVNNSIIHHQPGLLLASCVDGLTFKGNSLQPNNIYPRDNDFEAFEIQEMVVNCSIE